jgi:deferrochelatase/peroxidase EfeB
MLGDSGANHPDHWVGGLASPDLHAIVMLFARDANERERCRAEHERLLTRADGVKVLSTLDLEATPPFDYAHDHFGYRDRLSQPVIEGSGDTPTPGSGAPLKAGEFILGYPDENGHVQLPELEMLSRNGSFMAYRRLEEHVGKFRDFLRANGKTAEEQELVAAKLMGRWRSGAPLVLAPDKDDPALGADPQRHNDFNYKQQDPLGYAVPLGSHIRRMNLRDTDANMNRRRMIRRGATYGPPLPEGAPEDGAERGRPDRGRTHPVRNGRRRPARVQPRPYEFRARARDDAALRPRRPDQPRGSGKAPRVRRQARQPQGGV